jgi:hypothetical protein
MVEDYLFMGQGMRNISQIGFEIYHQVVHEIMTIRNILLYFLYYYYLLQLGFHPVEVVLTLVHTIQMEI